MKSYDCKFPNKNEIFKNFSQKIMIIGKKRQIQSIELKKNK